VLVPSLIPLTFVPALTLLRWSFQPEVFFQ